jgi:cell division protein FtsQ
MRLRPSHALLAAALLGGTVAGALGPGKPLREGLLSGFALERVASRGLVHLSPDEVARTACVAGGTPLLAVDPDEVEDRLRAHAWIREARVLRLPPGDLLLDVSERRPVALARIDGSDSLRLVDPSGLDFAPAPAGTTADLPLVHVSPGSDGDPQVLLRAALAAARSLREHGLPAPAEVWLEAGSDEGLALRLPGEPARVILGTAPWESKLERLARLRSAGLPEAASAVSIDLRFADRVVLRSDPPSQGGEAAEARGDAPPPDEDRTG